MSSRSIRAAWLPLTLLAFTGCSVLFDYPTAEDEHTQARCDNGTDDDLDGLTDCADPSCSAFCVENTAALCAGGKDEDDDGAIDCTDPDCSAFCVENTAALCSGGMDEDADGLVDCTDPDCSAFCVENTAALCSGGNDEDADGLVDCKDPDCSAFCVEDTAALCAGGKDEDADGLVDCRDPDCSAFCPEASAATCKNGADDDLDGNTDCDDSDCDGHCPEISPAECADGRDNDGDGLTDSEDARCWTAYPLTVQRCTSSPEVRVSSLLDQGWEIGMDPSAPWFTFGTTWGVDGNPLDVPEGRGERDDTALMFDLPRAVVGGSPAIESEPGGVALRRTLAGTWQDLEIRLSLRVPDRTWIRFALVPADLAPENTVPLASSEGAPLVVEIDARVRPPTLSLDLASSGHAVSIDAPPENGWFHLVVSGPASDSGSVHASLLADDSDAAWELDAPTSDTSLPPSRLVLWGSSSGVADPAGFMLQRWDAALDDVSVSLPGFDPCGVTQPPSPSGQTCGTVQADLGQLVSAAPGCMLVSVAPAPGYGSSTAVAAWKGTDGLTWTGPSLDALGAPPPSGAGGAPGSGGTPGGGTAGVGGGAAGGAGTPGAGGPAGPPPIPASCCPPGVSVVSGGPLQLCCTEGSECGTVFNGACRALPMAGNAPGAGGTGTGTPPVNPEMPRSLFAAPPGATLLGAGIAADGAGGYRAVLGWRTARDILVETATATVCDAWGPRISVAIATEAGSSEALPADLEDLSYVFDGTMHGLYFTRPPNDEVGRTLWRAVGSDGASFTIESHPLAELPEGVIPPVSVQLVGNDLVAIHALGASAKATGLGALVATPPALDVWERVLPWPLLEPSQETGTFDGNQLVAGALGGRIGDQPRWPLVYSGRIGSALPSANPYGPGPPMQGFPASVTAVAPSVAVGSAIVEAAGPPRPGAPTPSVAAAGLDPQRRDPVPPGPILVADSFDPDDTTRPTWDGNVRATELGTGMFSGDVRLTLDEPIVGDFELRASIHGIRVSEASIGLRSEDTLQTPPTLLSSLEGRFEYASAQGDALVPAVVVPFGGGYGSPATSAAGADWRRFYLRRVGGTLVAGWIADGECGVSGGSVLHFLTPVTDLRTLLVHSSAPLELDSLVVYALGDAAHCEATERMLCSEGGGGGGCVTVATDGAHCGSCDNVCPTGTECLGGECGCNYGTPCNGSCVDLSWSTEHCGACGNACQTGESCLRGACLAGAQCSAAATLTTDQSLDVDLSRYSPFPDGSLHCMDPYAAAFWASWTAPASGEALLSITAGNEANVWTNVCPASGYPQSLGCILRSGDGRLLFPVTAGQTYGIALQAGTGLVSLLVSMSRTCPTPTILSAPGTYPVDLSAGVDHADCGPTVDPPLGTDDSDSDAVFVANGLPPGAYEIRLDGVTGGARVGVIPGSSCLMTALQCGLLADGGVLTATLSSFGPTTILVEHENPAPISLTLTLARIPCAGEADLGSALGSVASGLLGDGQTQSSWCGPPSVAHLFSWTAPATGSYVFDTTGSTDPVSLELLTESCSGYTAMSNGCGSSSGMEFHVDAGRTVWIRLSSPGAPASGQFTLSIVEGGGPPQGPPCRTTAECPPGLSCLVPPGVCL